MRNSIKKPLFRIFDLFSAPFVFIFLPVLKIIRKYGVENFPLNRKSFLSVGVFPVCNHYYEPQLIYSEGFDAKKPRKLHVNFNLTGQLENLARLQYVDELKDFPVNGKVLEYTFYVNNPSFGPGDCDMYYLMIRNLKPKRVIEIGSGYSTLVAIEAVKKNRAEGYTTEMTCIEPYEMDWLEKKNEIKVVRESVEKMDMAVFKTLQEGDILFIDSSHIIRPENDVLFEYLELLPELNKGVVIHIHDIFSPRHYRSEWLQEEFRFWNEQYLLEAFLYYNDTFEIMYTLNHLKNDAFAESLKVLTHLTPESEPASFWMRKVK